MLLGNFKARNFFTGKYLNPSGHPLQSNPPRWNNVKETFNSIYFYCMKKSITAGFLFRNNQPYLVSHIEACTLTMNQHDIFSLTVSRKRCLRHRLFPILHFSSQKMVLQNHISITRCPIYGQHYSIYMDILEQYIWIY